MGAEETAVGAAPRETFVSLLRNTHLAVPEDLPAILNREIGRLGAIDAGIYLVDYEQRVLVPVPNPDGPPREDIAIESTVPGRCYRLLEVHQTGAPEGLRRTWVPILDGTERLGVLELVFPEGAGEGLDEDIRALARLVAELVATKGAYGDLFEMLKRRRPMSVSAELAWQLLPPLTVGTDRIVISAALVPIYDLGGDSFDYSVDPKVARIAIFDAMGHGLESGLLASVAIAAYRNCRRRGLTLAETVDAVDREISGQFGPERFVTAVLAELEVTTGCFRWSVSGHPPPLVLRRGKVVKTLEGNVGAPLGLGLHEPVAEDALEPGDQVILYSDGVIEARAADGEFFGTERLVDLIGRASASGNPPPETMRRLIHAILDHQSGDLQDDATIVFLQWRSADAVGLKM